MVAPFGNQSSAPGLEWIAEAFPEVLSERMASPQLYALAREDRAYAFDRSGIPSSVVPSRATIYRIAEQMGADYVVMGNYNFDGKTFTATAQLLDMRKLHLYAPVQSAGTLPNLIELQTMLAWELLQQMPSHPTATREQFLRASPPIRLDAFENYIRGVLATSHQQKVHYLRDAVKLNPNYPQAMLQLGKTYYDTREYESAASWFARVPKNDPEAGEANFLLGMSEFYRGNFDKAFAAFNYLATRLPLTEVLNNLGVVEARRGQRVAAVGYFTKAVAADPNDADYRFNLALAQFRNGDSAGASRQLKEELQQRPTDGEARMLLDVINRGIPPSSGSAQGNSLLQPAQPRLPLERIKRNYDEASYRQLELEIRNFAEARLAKMRPDERLAYHISRAKELLAQNMSEAAEREVEQALALEPTNFAALALKQEIAARQTGAK